MAWGVLSAAVEPPTESPIPISGRIFLLAPLLVLTLLGGTSAFAAEEETVIPEGCVDKSYCDGTQCYDPESSISRFACSCGLLNPTCGVGKCTEDGSYCDGEACGESSMCHPPNSPVSMVMCRGAEMGPSCEPPAGGCGVGSCVDGAWCDSCGCQPLDAAPSQALCQCELADARSGLGTCVDGAYCDGLESEEGQCHPADADVSRAMCRGIPLDRCAVPPVSSGECRDGSYCDEEQCHEVDSAISKMHCAFSEGAEGKAAALRTLGPLDVGVIPKKPWGCPAGSEYIQIYMDDEDSGNNNYNWGWIGATQQSSSGTRFGFCRVDGNKFRPLPRRSWADLRTETYAVLKLGSYCPAGSREFTRNFDNEDRNNANSRSGNIWPNVSNSNTSLRFCIFPPANSGTMPAFPPLGMEYGVFAAANYTSPYWLAQGYIHTDDEDRNNANSFSYNNTGNIGLLIHAMTWGVWDTEMRIAKVANLPNPCSKLVPYHNGTFLTATYDGANCYIKPVPPYGTPFIWSNNYYVTPGWNNSCIEGAFDGANCRIMNAPAGTTAFKWGNAFYYAE